MNPAKLFLKLSPEERDIATDVIQSIGIGYSAGTLDFRRAFKDVMYKHTGLLRELFKCLSRLDKGRQDRLFDVIGSLV